MAFKTKRILRYCLFALLGVSVSAQSWAVSGSNTDTGVFDSSDGTREIDISAADFPGSDDDITSICVAVHFAKHNDQAFVPANVFPPSGTPFHNETEFVLTSPDGTSVTLISNSSGTTSFNVGSEPFSGWITFDQSAADPVNIDPDLPSQGAFQPDPGDLDDFLSEDADGTWELYIQDDVGADALSFYAFDLYLNEDCPVKIASFGTTPAPIPSSSQWAQFLLIMSMMLGAGVYLRHRVKSQI